MRLASMLRSRPRRNFGSTSPPFSRCMSRKGECIQRTTGRCCQNSDSDRGGTWKLSHLRILGLSKKRGQSKRVTVVDMH
jgi:hypothetical protein